MMGFAAVASLALRAGHAKAARDALKAVTGMYSELAEAFSNTRNSLDDSLGAMSEEYVYPLAAELMDDCKPSKEAKEVLLQLEQQLSSADRRPSKKAKVPPYGCRPTVRPFFSPAADSAMHFVLCSLFMSGVHCYMMS